MNNPLKDEPATDDKQKDQADKPATETVKSDPITSGPQTGIPGQEGARELGLGTTHFQKPQCGRKTDIAAKAAEKPAEEVSKAGATEPRKEETNAQAAAAAKTEAKAGASEPPYHDDETYMAYMRDAFDIAKGSAQ